jgi:hypothetical protein
MASIGIAFTVGCAPTVQLEVPAAPAVSLPTHAVAVVAHERVCQPAADALARELGDSDGVTVDHRAPLRLELIACGDDQSWTVEQVGSDDQPQRQRTTVAARAHAVVAVVSPDGVRAHLIGTGRHLVASSWSEPTRLAHVSRTAHRHVLGDLAADLAHQVSPVPTMVERRVYPNAGPGSARELHNLAVRAEQRGDLDLAWLLAQAAWNERPTPARAGYLDELRRRRQVPLD